MLESKQNFSNLEINQKINYKDVDLLKLFITEQGKIIPRRLTGVTLQQQRQMELARQKSTSTTTS